MKRSILFSVLVLLVALSGAAQKEYCLENGAVHAFLTDFTYESISDYSRSVVSDYNSSVYYSGSRHHPLPVDLSWTRTANAQAQTVMVSERADFEGAISFEVAATASSFSVYNLIPGRTYYYKVLAKMPNGTTVVEASESFKTTGQVRMIKVDGVNNVRDIGGWPAAFGQRVCYGRVFRGGNLDAITASGREAFRDKVGVSAELDLRRSDETVITASPLGADVPYLRISTTEYYDGMVNNSTTLINDFKWIIRNLRQGRPTMFHCLIGADRTGTLAFMQEGVLGLSEYDLCRDYELTTFSVVGTRLRTQLSDMVAYVKRYTGSTLQNKFYNFLLSKGMTRDELDDYIAVMLDNYTLPQRIETASDQYALQAGDTVMLSPHYYPVDYVPSVVYSSSNPSVATVDELGRVVARSAGEAVVRVSVGFHSEIFTEVRVCVVAGKESAVPRQVTVADDGAFKVYNLASSNIIANGSFEYPESMAQWTTINAEPLPMSKFLAASGGASHGARYLQSKSNGDVNSSASIVRAMPVQPGKTYALGYAIRTVDGTTVNNNADFKIFLRASSTAQGSTDDFHTQPSDSSSANPNKPGGTVDDFIIGSPSFVGATPNEPVELPFHPSYGGEWTQQVCIFTVPEGYTWCELQFANMGSNGGGTCLDNFYLVQAEQDVSANVASAYLDKLVSNLQLTNCGSAPLQHPADKLQAVINARNAAQNLDSQTTSDIVNAANALLMALADYESAPLNMPDPQQCYRIMSGGKVLAPTVEGARAAFAQSVADEMDCGFRFLYTTQSDAYIIEHPLDDGTSLYLCNPSATSFSLTSDISAATVFVVKATADEGQSTLTTADGYESPFTISLEPDYGILNAITPTESRAIAPTQYYMLDGTRRQALQPGLNIMRRADGTVSKMLNAR